MAHGKRRFKMDQPNTTPLPLIEPVAMPVERGWHPNRMTPEQITEIRAAGELIAQKWADLEAAMVNGLLVQKRTQGGWPVAGRGPAHRARQEVSLFLFHLFIKPEIVLPPFPGMITE